MKVFGFTKCKDLVEVDLSEETVARLRIHPSWVDLFDPDPIVLNMGDYELFFTRLREIVFVILESENKGTMVVLEKDGVESFFDISLKEKSLSGGRKFFTAVSAMEDDFEDLYCKFLATDQKDGLPAISKISLELFFEKIYYPMFAKSFQDKKRLVFIERDKPRFNGRMFDLLDVPKKLPYEINWVFEAFSSWKPVVFGGCLRDSFVNSSPQDVDFIVDGTHKANLRNNIQFHLESLGVEEVKELTEFDQYGPLTEPVFEFTRDGVKYHLVCLGNELVRNFWLLNDFSVNQLQAVEPDRVIASRIALWDLAQRKTRIVARLYSFDLVSKWLERRDRMHERGFEVVTPNLFGTDRFERLEQSIENIENEENE